jgi:membrane-associated phospholipid phosphatase
VRSEEIMMTVSHRFALVGAIALSWIPATAAAQPSPSTAPAGPAEPAPPIAPPAPDAPPEKIEQAEDTARAAQLTPIVPSPGEATRPAFQLYAEVDLPVLTIGIVFAGVRFIQTRTAYCAPLCDRNDLNALDRTTAGRWSPSWLLASNVGLIATSVGAVALLSDHEGAVNALNDALVIAESALSATAAASVMTIAAGRPRPFMYSEASPLSERNSTDAANSFLSSHAAVGFAIATSTYVAMRRLHPRSQLSYAVLGLGLGGAAFVATSRVLAGQHFITDALGGALVGSSVGVLISSLHGSPVSIVPVTGEHQHGLGIQGRF